MKRMAARRGRTVGRALSDGVMLRLNRLDAMFGVGTRRASDPEFSWGGADGAAYDVRWDSDVLRGLKVAGISGLAPTRPFHHVSPHRTLELPATGERFATIGLPPPTWAILGRGTARRWRR